MPTSGSTPTCSGTIAALPAEVGGVAAFSIQEREYIVGYGYAPWYVHARFNVRLVRKGKARIDDAALIHESFAIDGAVQKLRGGVILHHRALSITDDVARTSTYAALKAEQKFRAGRRTSLGRLILAPAMRFIKSYVFQRYFTCGKAGLHLFGDAGPVCLPDSRRGSTGFRSARMRPRRRSRVTGTSRRAQAQTAAFRTPAGPLRVCRKLPSMSGDSAGEPARPCPASLPRGIAIRPFIAASSWSIATKWFVPKCRGSARSAGTSTP